MLAVCLLVYMPAFSDDHLEQSCDLRVSEMQLKWIDSQLSQFNSKPFIRLDWHRVTVFLPLVMFEQRGWEQEEEKQVTTLWVFSKYACIIQF